MKFFNTTSKMILAGALAGLLSTTAAFAQATEYNQLKDALTSQFVTLNVPSEGLGMLTLTQLTELTAIMTNSQNDEVKAQAAKEYLDTTLMPMMVAIDSPEGMAMVATLKEKMSALNVAYPTEPLSTMQVQTLLNVFVTTEKETTEIQKQGVDAALASFSRPATLVNTTPGAQQIEEQVYAKLLQVGITPPPANTVSFENLNKLQAILDAADTEDARKKEAAMVVLNGN